MAATNRRTVLAGLFGGCALVAAGGGYLWYNVGYETDPEDHLLILDAKEALVLRALFEVLMPKGSDLPTPKGMKLIDRFDELVWSASDEERADFQGALSIIEHAPPRYGQLHRLSALSIADRGRFLGRVLTGDHGDHIRALTGLKQLCYRFTYGHPNAWTPIGYDGPWVLEAVPHPSRGAYEAAKAELAKKSEKT